MTSQLIIKAHAPHRTLALVLLLIASVTLVAWLTFQYGYIQAGYDNKTLKGFKTQLEEQLYQEGQLNSKLREKFAIMERSTKIDKVAFLKVDDSIRDLQDEIIELKEEVTFYRGIVSPTETASGLDITSLRFQQITKLGGYHFKLVLTQLKKNDRVIVGTAKIYVDGILNGLQKRLTLSNITKGHMQDLKLRFKYFQTIEADVVLPEGFTASSVTVDLKPRGKNRPRIKKTFDWADINVNTF